MTTLESEYNDLLIFSGKLATGSMLIPILFAIYYWKFLNKPLKLFFWYCFLTFSLNVLEVFFIWSTVNYKETLLPLLKKWDIKNTSFYSILFFSKDFIFLGLFLKETLKHRVNISWVQPIIMLLLISTWANHLFIEGFRAYGVFNRTVDAIFCFAIPLYFLWFIFNENSKVPIVKNPYFWIGLGLISTALIGFYLFLAGDKIRATDKVLFFKLAIVKNVIMMIEQVLEAIGFYYARYTKYLPQNTPSP